MNEYTAYGSLTPSSTTGAEVKTLGCESVAYQVLSAASSPQVKAYGADPAGTFIPVRYRLITVAGVESLIDPDTASGVLQAGDRVIVPNNGYDQIRISTTAGTMTANATRNFFGGVQYEIQKLIDGGISASVSITSEKVDDTAFTPATSSVLASGFFADETATDSVDEGDIGAARMTLNRRQIMASQVLDDGAFGVGTEYVTSVGFLADETATDSVDEGDVGAARMTLDRKQIATTYAHAAGGASVASAISAATTNPTNVKNAAGTLYAVSCSNINASPRYLKFYDSTSAVEGTLVALTPVLRVMIPGNTSGTGTNITIPVGGMAFSTGISYRLVTGITDADATATAASEQLVNIVYK